MHLLFAMGILMGPTHQLELATGAGVFRENPHFVVSPAYQIRSEGWHLSLVAPLRLSINTFKSFDGDWNQPDSWGRSLDEFALGDTFQFGHLSDMSDPFQLVFYRFYNRVFDDAYGTGGVSRHSHGDVSVTVLTSHVQQRPIVGAFIDLQGPNLMTSLQTGWDTLPLIDPASAGETQLWASGVNLQYGWQTPWSYRLLLHGSIATQYRSEWTGALHGGFTLMQPSQRGVRLFFEGMRYARAYVWAPFDTVYTLTRITGVHLRQGAYRTGNGIRTGLTYRHQKLTLGIESSMGQQTAQFSYRGRMGYEVAQVEFEANVFGSPAINRSAQTRLGQLVGALVMRLNATKHWSIAMTVAHTIRRDEYSDPHGFLETFVLSRWRYAAR